MSPAASSSGVITPEPSSSSAAKQTCHDVDGS
jgi:hypothetical protein